MAAPRTVMPNGQRIRQLRLDRAWTTQELAEQAGCPIKSVSNAEAGEPVLLETLSSIANALGISPAALIQEQAE